MPNKPSGPFLARLTHAGRSLVAISALLAGVPATATDSIQVETPRGAIIEVIAEKPDGEGPFPAVILGSGSGYHARLPILERTAQALLEKGIAVYRVDWAYRVAGTPFNDQPRDKKAEIEDLHTALDYARADPQVDNSRIALAGKSLGSVIAWQLLRVAPEVKGAILLTPVCDPAEDPEAPDLFYPALGDEDRPRLWILGDVDPVCPVTVLQQYIAAGGKGDRIAIISGDHSYLSPLHPERDARALDLATRLTTDFAETLLAPAQPAN